MFLVKKDLGSIVEAFRRILEDRSLRSRWKATSIVSRASRSIRSSVAFSVYRVAFGSSLTLADPERNPTPLSS